MRRSVAVAFVCGFYVGAGFLGGVALPPVTIGRVLAFLVLIACFVLFLMGQLDLKTALLVGALALAMVVP